MDPRAGGSAQGYSTQGYYPQQDPPAGQVRASSAAFSDVEGLLCVFVVLVWFWGVCWPRVVHEAPLHALGFAALFATWARCAQLSRAVLLHFGVR